MRVSSSERHGIARGERIIDFICAPPRAPFLAAEFRDQPRSSSRERAFFRESDSLSRHHRYSARRDYSYADINPAACTRARARVQPGDGGGDDPAPRGKIKIGINQARLPVARAFARARASPRDKASSSCTIWRDSLFAASQPRCR